MLFFVFMSQCRCEFLNSYSSGTPIEADPSMNTIIGRFDVLLKKFVIFTFEDLTNFFIKFFLDLS
jgi:hypothetical protein